jgi:hypothetical protein
MHEYIKNTDINYSDISVYIPDVMNAMYNEHALNAIHIKEIRDAFRIKMMQSKAWLIQKFLEQKIDKSKSILIVGGWLGFTSWVLFKNGYGNITEIDVDSRLHEFSMHLNRFNHNFKHIPVDVNQTDTSMYDVIINTSCEHIIDSSWFDNTNSNCMFVLQSNNINTPDHINKCNSIDEMILKYPMAINYSGSVDYGDTTSRFMLIGSKK